MRGDRWIIVMEETVTKIESGREQRYGVPVAIFPLHGEGALDAIRRVRALCPLRAEGG